MKKIFLLYVFAIVLLSTVAHGQAPAPSLIEIVKAEDARAFDDSLNTLLSNSNPFQVRAALAAGRIGDEKAIVGLSHELEYSKSVPVRSMCAFALGEIESIKAADILLKVLSDANTPDPVRASIVEAAGKIAAANAKDPKSAELGKAILDTLEAEFARGAKQSRDVVLLALTAALRVRPEKADAAVAKFLTNTDARVRADAGNTMARIRGKNANELLRSLVINDSDAVARANAARALGATDDKEAIDVLQQAAVGDEDLRARVSSIRGLGGLQDAKSGVYLVAYGEALLIKSQRDGVLRGRAKTMNELLEVVTSIGRLLQNTENERAIKFLENVRAFDQARSSETEIALARITPNSYVDRLKTIGVTGTVAASKGVPALPRSVTWQKASNVAQGLAELAASAQNKDAAQREFNRLKTWIDMLPKAAPDILRSYAKFKTDDLTALLRANLLNKDVFVRTTAAELIAELPSSKQNVAALNTAFTRALLTDKAYDDAQLAILDALFKIDKEGSVGTLGAALNSPDFLVRKKAYFLLKDGYPFADLPVPAKMDVVQADAKGMYEVLPYHPSFGTKLGQVLNINADYRRALLRKNGQTKAVLTTEKGTFTIDLLPEDAPLTVDNFIKLARSRYFNGVEVHRVVPNFVMQDGDPRGDGNGGPGWSIRCEINMVPFDRGAVGMALSGKDTGGSQWFVTHSPQPHLDGGYTVFGHVNETDMKVVDNIVRGDKIISVRIVEGRGHHKGTKGTK